MSNFVSVIFCGNCKSRYVEISEWDGNKAIIRCRTCNSSETVGKFILGRCKVSNTELQNARDTTAKPGRPER